MHGLQWLWHWGSVVIAHRPSCSTGLWNLSRPGIEPVAPALAGRFISTVPPGKSPLLLIVDTLKSLSDNLNICVFSGFTFIDCLLTENWNFSHSLYPKSFYIVFWTFYISCYVTLGFVYQGECWYTHTHTHIYILYKIFIIYIKYKYIL